MKNFINKLIKEKTIEIIEPTEVVSNAYLKKSESNLESAKLLLENNRLEESVYLSYYSMYNMLLSLLFRVGIKSENHSASIILLNSIFALDNGDISNAKKERLDKQYYVDFYVTKDQVLGLLKKTEIFNSKILDFISKIKNEDIKEYRKKFADLVNRE